MTSLSPDAGSDPELGHFSRPDQGVRLPADDDDFLIYLRSERFRVKPQQLHFPTLAARIHLNSPSNLFTLKVAASVFKVSFYEGRAAESRPAAAES